MLQALSQQVHGNAALSVTESGKFSLVDHIMQEDYTQAPSPLPPKVPQSCPFRIPITLLHQARANHTAFGCILMAECSCPCRHHS